LIIILINVDIYIYISIEKQRIVFIHIYQHIVAHMMIYESSGVVPPLR
jgi:hypothetical protein